MGDGGGAPAARVLRAGRPLSGARGGRRLGVLIAIVLLALNLRTVIASLPPLLAAVRDDLGLSAGVAGLLTTLPVICFGALAPVAPRLARRVSLERILVGVAVVTAVAAALRGVAGTAGLFCGSVLAGAGVAIGQAALPVLIRSGFPGETGLLTGAYSMALPLGATLAGGLSVPLEQALGGSWRASLAFWALPAVLAAAVWVPLAAASATRVAGAPPLPLRGDHLAWWVALYFGIQSISFYAGLAWLPEILQAGGWSDEAAGALQALGNLVSLGPAFLVPVLAARRPNQTALLVAIVATPAVGIAGLLAGGGSLAPLWVILLGLGQGGALGLGLILSLLRAGDERTVASLTAMSLCVGYLLAATGPFVLGAVHDATGGWTWPLAVLLGVTLLQLAPGWPASRDRVLR